jgi:hypothetical protein
MIASLPDFLASRIPFPYPSDKMLTVIFPDKHTFLIYCHFAGVDVSQGDKNKLGGSHVCRSAAVLAGTG